LILRDSLLCIRLANALFERGINVQPMRYPAVEESSVRLRFFVTCEHTEEQIDFTLAAVVEPLRELRGAEGKP